VGTDFSETIMLKTKSQGAIASIRSYGALAMRKILRGGLKISDLKQVIRLSGNSYAAVARKAALALV
jgi:hypothetical protein